MDGDGLFAWQVAKGLAAGIATRPLSGKSLVTDPSISSIVLLKAHASLILLHLILVLVQQ